MENVGLDRAFWSSRRVLVTGHTGFKGTWLSLWLASLGAQVWGYALPPETEPSLFEASGLEAETFTEFGDVRDGARLKEFLRAARPHVVMHLAAQPLVRESYDSPVQTFETNVMGTVQLLEAARSFPGIEAVVVVTSDKCYQNRGEQAAYDEAAVLGGSDPYSASKACAELITSSYRTAFLDGLNVPVASVRAGNVIGGGDWSRDRIVPDIVAAITQERELVLRYPSAVRPWQHVLEPLYGYLFLAQSMSADPALAGAWNFGPSAAADFTVAALAERFIGRWDTPRKWRHSTAVHQPEHTFLKLDSSKAADRLGVRARLSFDETCEWTVEWYRRWYGSENARTLCLQQIEAYEALA